MIVKVMIHHKQKIIFIPFDTMVHPVSKRYLSEDYAFSQNGLI